MQQRMEGRLGVFCSYGILEQAIHGPSSLAPFTFFQFSQVSTLQSSYHGSCLFSCSHAMELHRSRHEEEEEAKTPWGGRTCSPLYLQYHSPHLTFGLGGELPSHFPL